MKPFKPVAIVLSVALVLSLTTACSSDNDKKSGSDNTGTISDGTGSSDPGNAEQSTIRFSQLVLDLMSNSDNAEKPVDINTLQIELDHDESQFDGLF